MPVTERIIASTTKTCPKSGAGGFCAARCCLCNVSIITPVARKGEALRERKRSKHTSGRRVLRRRALILVLSFQQLRIRRLLDVALVPDALGLDVWRHLRLGIAVCVCCSTCFVWRTDARKAELLSPWSAAYINFLKLDTSAALPAAFPAAFSAAFHAAVQGRSAVFIDTLKPDTSAALATRFWRRRAVVVVVVSFGRLLVGGD
ncbi:hypothetical protein IWX50DRAFT_264512 [Phyllosticta citricarpa]